MKRTPQEKKRLSLARDRRNVYGESPHGARKSIPKNKRLRVRVLRRLAQIPQQAIDDDAIEVDSATSKIELKRKASWRKYRDAPLGDVLEAKKRRRERLQANPRKRKR
jgi:hypothetical protein